MIQSRLLVLALLLAVGCATSDQANERAKAIMYEMDYRIQNQLSGTESFLTRIAKSGLGGNVTQCDSQIAALIKTNKNKLMGVALPDGAVLCGAPLPKTRVNIAQQSYFKRALLSNSVASGDLEPSALDGESIIGYAVPFHDADGQLRAIIFVEEDTFADVGWLISLLHSRGADDAELILIDSQGKILAAVPEQKKWKGQSLSSNPLGQAMLSKSEGMIETSGLDGVMRVYSYSTPKWAQGNWHLALGVPK